MLTSKHLICTGSVLIFCASSGGSCWSSSARSFALLWSFQSQQCTSLLDKQILSHWLDYRVFMLTAHGKQRHPALHVRHSTPLLQRFHRLNVSPIGHWQRRHWRWQGWLMIMTRSSLAACLISQWQGRLLITSIDMNYYSNLGILAKNSSLSWMPVAFKGWDLTQPFL